MRRYLAEGKVKSYEQGELVVKLLEKVLFADADPADADADVDADSDAEQG